MLLRVAPVHAQRWVITVVSSSLLILASVSGPVFGGNTVPRGTFGDDDGSVHEGNIEAIAVEGITTGCSSVDATLYCPRDAVTRGQMASFLARALSLGPVDDDADFTDHIGSVHRQNINAIREAGITTGCSSVDATLYCPRDLVTRGQMASFLARALDLPNREVTNIEGGYSILMPKDWTATQDVLGEGSTAVFAPGKVSNPIQEFVGDVLVETIRNPGEFDLASFYAAQPVDLFGVSSTYEPFDVDGMEAVRFFDVPGMLPGTLVAVRMTSAVLEIRDMVDTNQVENAFDFIVFSVREGS